MSKTLPLAEPHEKLESRVDAAGTSSLGSVAPCFGSTLEAPPRYMRFCTLSKAHAPVPMLGGSGFARSRSSGCLQTLMYLSYLSV